MIEVLSYISNSSVQLLVRNNIIQEKESPIYRYGFELFWSTFLCVMSIIAIGEITGNLNKAICFLLYFMPIRTFAGGYHAKSYRNCFLLTNFLNAFSIVLSSVLVEYVVVKIIGLCLGFFSLFYIWENSPVVFKAHPIKKEVARKNRHYTHRLILLELPIFIFQYIRTYQVFYTAAITICIVAVMMFISINKEEKKHEFNIDGSGNVYSKSC